jgi:hypothetical protein
LLDVLGKNNPLKVRFEIFTAVIMKEESPVPTSQETHYVSATGTSRLMLCASKIGSFHGGDYKERLLLRWLLVTTNAFPGTMILFTLLMEAILSSETSVLTRAIRRYIPEDSILQPVKY